MSTVRGQPHPCRFIPALRNVCQNQIIRPFTPVEAAEVELIMDDMRKEYQPPSEAVLREWENPTTDTNTSSGR